MISSHCRNKIIIEIISLLFILLFVYAALSKFLDFENFQVQLGQSPILNLFAGEISWSIPIIEIVISIMLAVPIFRKFGLFAAFTLMVIFTAYIFFILNYSSFIPCSCGGILEKMGWKAHFIFNCFFIVLAIVALVLLFKVWKNTNRKFKYLIYKLIGLGVIGISIVVLLFKINDTKNFKRNNFVRMFPPVAVKNAGDLNLQYNSYYFAGAEKGSIYLGNTTASGLVLELDTLLKKSRKHYIHLEDTSTVFYSSQLRISGSHFFLLDGSAKANLKGNTNDWRTMVKLRNYKPYSLAEIRDSTSIIFRSLSEKTGENVLGTSSFESEKQIHYNPHLLQKQVDGVFDTDGSMNYSSELQKFIYVYYYRNQFIVTDKSLNLIYRGKTIDTISKAKIKIAWLKNRNEKKLAAPAFTVNKSSAVHGKLLFINSALPGLYEPIVMWKQASIIDVYELVSGNYLLSFYIYNYEGKKISSFIVNDTHLYALVGNSIVVYRLGEAIKSKMKLNNNSN